MSSGGILSVTPENSRIPGGTLVSFQSLRSCEVVVERLQGETDRACLYPDGCLNAARWTIVLGRAEKSVKLESPLSRGLLRFSNTCADDEYSLT